MKSLNLKNEDRRKFVKAFFALASAALATSARAEAQAITDVNRNRSLKLTLNAYSFNAQLLNGTMSINDMLEFCAAEGLTAVDITAYYFKGYPDVPSDETLYQVKNKAFHLGLEISGTGVRNDFTHADATKRKESVQLVKNWIDAAEKLGAQTVRIFSGNQKPEGHSRSQILEWMLTDIRECVAYGKAHGIVVALQNHNDFIKTAAETVQIMEAIKSDWFGLMLDIGSFRTADPYEEIAQTIQYAVTWQIKEKVFVGGKETDVDADRLVHLIKSSAYRGYLPLETLGQGDPKIKIRALLARFREALDRI